MASRSLLITLVLAMSGCFRSAPPDTELMRAQVFLAEWNGVPLISANYDGRFQPYVWRDGKLAPVLPSAARRAFPDVDFYRPTPLSAGELLLAGVNEKSWEGYNVYWYRVADAKLVNLTRDPAHAEKDQGEFCLDPERRLLGRRADDEFFVEKVDGEGGRTELGRIPRRFERCRFAPDPRSSAGVALLGVERRTDHASQIWKCELREKPECREEGGLRDHGDALREFQQESAEAAYWLPKPDSALVRVGRHGRYWIGGLASPETVVFRARRVGGELYAIVADPWTPRSLAIWEGGTWKPLLPGFLRAKPVPRDSAAIPEELWIRTPAGKLVQAYYFGPPDPASVVLWWHGGERDNISPRLYPYFERLKAAGFGVLAPNFPGSSGRGRAYELRTSEADLVDAIQGVARVAFESGARRIVSWSVSSGSRAQAFLLKHGVPVSALVDQVGTYAVDRQAAYAASLKIPYFSIRGRFDPTLPRVGAPGFAPSFVYDGGHDIEIGGGFSEALSGAIQFMESAPPVDPARFPRPARPSLILDPGHEGNRADPNQLWGLREAELTFDVAREIARECRLPGEVLWSRAGSRSLQSPAQGLARRKRMIESYPDTPWVSLHFNARPAGAPPGNLASVFVPEDASPAAIAIARKMVSALGKLGLPPQMEYPHLAKFVKLLAPGVFARELAMTPVQASGCRFLIEASYYDDPEESGRLKATTLEPDGTLSRPRARAIARALCPALREIPKCASP